MLEMETPNAVNETAGTTEMDSAPENVDQAQSEAKSALTLDNVDEFIFQGHKWTPEELNKAMLRHADYTRKTQEIAEQRKYISNLAADLELVRQNPTLVEQFKSVYPKEFHSYLRFAIAEQKADLSDDADDSVNLPKSVMEKLSKLDKLEEKLRQMDEMTREREVEAASKQLDVILDKFSGKYPFAVEDAVLNQAQALIDMNKDNPRFQMTEATWERIFKQVNDKIKTKVETQYKSRLEEQLKKNQKAGDIGPGGMAPGRGPSGPRTIAEATEMAIQDFRAQGAR